ncbi:RnfABCDGE type electron transport complex subunit G [Thiothrix fructosivorans]|uniref:Ion-translocating oxidoreductase complex subunit G n=1 Tax=Thiothrix fructosivorans TaxID=111770 RepID=A0A8B0SM15_9GAMM|nr:RnfABCDGE type electron transport complex subunit G [Thiothrix fructosivorans]MBO0612136.1 RnfABCDGE type electron transport complex subunit G [Thiothrix fructosivorans]QTX12366.1 RnfABCDGE type electron transport complex subunit G [Thiothrix fructosivorans]
MSGNTSTSMIVTLGFVTALSGFLIVTAYQTTKPAIEENKRLRIQQTVLEVIKGATAYKPFVITANGDLLEATPDLKGTNVYAGYDAQGKLMGLAAEGRAQGYSGSVETIYAYSPACECITGVKVIKQTETPGLGDKVITNKDFVANFEKLDAKLDAAGKALANAIVTVKHGSKKNPWEVDAISGATISSRAIAKGLNGSAQEVLPKVVPLLSTIEGAKP